jgi:hypothetical protein
MRKALKGKTLFHTSIVLFLLGAAVLPTRIAMAERITFPADVRASLTSRRPLAPKVTG